jgi:hypothetical protein
MQTLADGAECNERKATRQVEKWDSAARAQRAGRDANS